MCSRRKIEPEPESIFESTEKTEKPKPKFKLGATKDSNTHGLNVTAFNISRIRSENKP
jgi:hypothetical protein